MSNRTPVKRLNERRAASRPKLIVTERPQIPEPAHLYPKVGQQYLSRDGGKHIVEVVRIVEHAESSTYFISYRVLGNGLGLPNAPLTLNAEDFFAAHKPYSLEAPTGPPPPLAVVDLASDEEWLSLEHDEYLAILSVDQEKAVVRTRGKRTSRTRVYSTRDFTDVTRFRKIQRKSVYQRLLEEDD